MKNKLYGIFDLITMVFSPLVENLFDHAEVWGARRAVRSGKRGLETESNATALRNARTSETRHRELFVW